MAVPRKRSIQLHGILRIYFTLKTDFLTLWCGFEKTFLTLNCLPNIMIHLCPSNLDIISSTTIEMLMQIIQM